MGHAERFFRSTFSEIRNPKVFGLALHRAWIATFYFSSHHIMRADIPNSGLLNIYTLSLLSLGLVLVLAGLFPLSVKKITGYRGIVIASPLIMSFSSLLLLLAHTSGTTLFLTVFCGVLTGISSGIMFLYWGDLYGRSPIRVAQIHSVFAFVVAVFIYLLFLFLYSLEVYIIATTILPLISGLILVKALKAQPETRRELKPASSGEPHMIRVAAAALIISFVNGAFFGIPRILSSSSAVQTSTLSSQAFYTLTLLGSTLLLAIIISIIIFMTKKSDLGLVYRFVLLFFIVGAILTPFKNGLGSFSSVMTIAGYSCFELIFWIALSNISYRYHISPLRVFGLGRAGWVFGCFLGAFYPPKPLIDSLLIDTTAVPFLLTAFLIILILFTYSFVLPERSIITITTGYTNKKGTLPSRCEQLSRQFGLSQRESEVLSYLVKGRDTVAIQKTLNISAGTVSTHRQRIYQKTGVHSRQELLDLLEQIELVDIEES